METTTITENDIISAFNQLKAQPRPGLKVHMYPWMLRELQKNSKAYRQVINYWNSRGVRKVILIKQIKEP